MENVESKSLRKNRVSASNHHPKISRRAHGNTPKKNAPIDRGLEDSINLLTLSLAKLLMIKVDCFDDDDDVFVRWLVDRQQQL